MTIPEQQRETERPQVDIENFEHYAKVRYDICRGCEHFRMYLCNQCGCFMPAKVRLRGVACPIGRWAAIKD